MPPLPTGLVSAQADLPVLPRYEDPLKKDESAIPKEVPAPAEAAATPTPTPAAAAVVEDSFMSHYGKLFTGMGLLYALDSASKSAFIKAGIAFPSSLVFMFTIPLILIAMGEKNAAGIRTFFSPALDWIAKWLPLFYVPSLVTLPLALATLTGSELVKILGILSFGMCGTLLFTAYTTQFIRGLVKTENKAVPKSKKATPFIQSHYIAWGCYAAVSLAAIATNAMPSLSAEFALVFGLAATVGGYLVGQAIPSSLHGVFHPVVVTALAANGSCALYGAVANVPYDNAMKMYLAKGSGPMGAGDLLMSFLGSVIISMGFRIYDQRDTMKRHATEILGATFLSSLFSFFSTAFAAKALGLSAGLARALIPRSVTVALAIPIAGQLDAPVAITAAADTIARGLAAAGTGGGLGTASLTSKEPEALPFCALSYSLVGITSTCLAATPFMRDAIIAIVG
eukprot:gene16410-22617_t